MKRQIEQITQAPINTLRLPQVEAKDTTVKTEANVNVQPQKLSDRVAQTTDIISVSAQVVTSTTYERSQTSSHPLTINLPSDYSYLDLHAIKTSKECYNEYINLGIFISAVSPCDDLNDFEDILKYFRKAIGENFHEKCVNAIVISCSVDKISKCNYLINDLKLKLYPHGGEYAEGKKLNEQFCTYFLKSTKVYKFQSRIPDFKTVEERFKAKLNSWYLNSIFAIICQNVSGVDKAFRFILNKLDFFLEKTIRDVNIQDDVFSNLCSILQFITPNYQKQYISKYRSYFEKNVSFANCAHILLERDGNLALAVDISQKALRQVDKSTDIKELGFCHYNIAHSLIALGDFEQALLYAQQAYRYLPTEIDALKQILDTAVHSNRLDLRDEIIENLTCIHLRNLLLITSNMSRLEDLREQSKVLAIKRTMIPEKFHDLLFCVRFVVDQIQKRNSDSSGIINAVHFKHGIERLKNQNLIRVESLLSIAVYFNQLDIARNLLEETSIEYMQNSYMMWEYKALLQGGNMQFVWEIESCQVSKAQKADLHFSAAGTSVTMRNFEAAAEHVQAAIASQPDNQDYKQAFFLITALTNDKDKIQDSLKQLDANSQGDIISTFVTDVIVEAGEDEEVEEAEVQEKIILEPTNSSKDMEVKFDHKKIHAHFQALKAQRLAELSSFNSNLTRWQVKGVSVSSNQTTVVKFIGLTYHTYIDPKFESTESSDSFRSSLEKGFVTRARGQNGIKAFRSVFEVKNNSDLRLYTNKVYVNSQKQSLLFFDRMGNHEAVKNFAAENKRETVYC